MKRTLKALLFAVLTFFVGITLSTLSILNLNIPDIQNPDDIGCSFPGSLSHRFPIYEDEMPSLLEKQAVITGIPVNFRQDPLEVLPICIDEIYRFVLLPTSQIPVSIRIWRRSDDERLLTVEKLDGPDRAYATVELTNSVSKEEWLKFKQLLEQTSFWDMPKFNKDKPVSSNETKWIIEGLKDNKYHNVQLLIPSNKFRETFSYLLKLSGQELENEYKEL